MAGSCDPSERAGGGAARAFAAGPQRARAALRRIRRVRGRRAGGPARGLAAVAGGGVAGQPEGVVDHHRVPPADRAVAQRVGAAAPRGSRRITGGTDPWDQPGSRRHAHPAVAVLSPGADDGLPGRPDAARRRRVDHRRDRPCVRAGGGSGSVQPRPGPQISGCVGWLRGLRCLPLRNRTLSSVAITPRDVMDDLRRYRGQRDPRRRGGQTVPSCQAGTPSLSASPAASRRIVAGPRSRSSGSTLRANRLNRAVSGDSS